MKQLTRYRPSRGLRSLQDEVDRVFESFFAPFREEDGEEGLPAAWTPRMDVTETDGAYRLQMDLPGMSKDDITVRMEDNRLMVSGERHDEKTTEDENYVHTERSFGSFYRSMRLPKSVQEGAIDASFRNGVLSIELPKTEESAPKKIEVK